MITAALTTPQTAYDGIPDLSAKESLRNVLNAPPSPPQSKRTDSAISLPRDDAFDLRRGAEENSEYEAEWRLYLGLEDEWGFVLKDQRNEKKPSTSSNGKIEEEKNEKRYEEEWSAYLELDYSGEW
ncbi:uncharacterized protein N0V89_002332 [Didymosphaeria variabile]|uniref:Uncharacterized protein n=1 Tax=Didymosphaeria variabile TaxID=1932322 RepID=A0A9W9CDH6_9PLEO|nr:uncharacterized protein N0V89_002332 [Didymosphaeria variabile]KAJ4357756.1 hypothetical protein N0V89_002332 [Didymosphaeria variabile]